MKTLQQMTMKLRVLLSCTLKNNLYFWGPGGRRCGKTVKDRNQGETHTIPHKTESINILG